MHSLYVILEVNLGVPCGPYLSLEKSEPIFHPLRLQFYLLVKKNRDGIKLISFSIKILYLVPHGNFSYIGSEKG